MHSPFVQRVWIALEVKGLGYQYVEVDPYKKPEALLEVNPRGLVPALRHGNWGSYESTVLLEYVSFLFVVLSLKMHLRYMLSLRTSMPALPCFHRIRLS
jgi:glutathione S-transferase